MLVISCIKQVPDTTQVKIDPVTNTLIRDGIPFIMNPYESFTMGLKVTNNLLTQLPR